MISTLLLLLLLAAGVGFIALIGIAVAQGRIGVVAVALLVCLAFVLVIPLGIFAAIFISIMSRHSFSFAEPTQLVVNGIPQWTSSSQVAPNYTWGIAATPVLLILCAFVAALVFAARRGLGHAAAAGHARIWPAFIVVPIILFLLFGGIRYQASSANRAASISAQQANEVARLQQFAITNQNATSPSPQEIFVQQKLATAQQVAAVFGKDFHKQIENSDIHKLMDEFDAPRIVLQVPLTPTTAPAALILAVAPSTLSSAAKAADDSIASQAESTAEEETAKSSNSSKPNQAKQKHSSKNQHGALAAKKPLVPEPPNPPLPGEAELPDSANHSDEKNVKLAAASTTETSATAKPAWINAPPKRTGETRREVIETEAYQTADECYRAADIYLMWKAYDRLQELVDRPYAFSSIPGHVTSISFQGDTVKADSTTVWDGSKWNDYRLLAMNEMGLGADVLRREIIAKNPKNNETCEFVDTVDSSVGPMKKLYVQAEFTPAVDRELKQHWDAYHRGERFVYVGAGAFSVLSLICMVWGLLKVDTATRGYYSQWLFLGVPAAIIGAILLTALIALNPAIHR